MIISVHHIAIICADYERSKHFYTDVLGLEIIAETYRKERQSFKLDLALNGIYTIELFSLISRPKDHHSPSLGLTHLAFAVDDLDKEVLSLQRKGIVVEPIRTDALNTKRFTFFADPDDLPIEFYEI